MLREPLKKEKNNSVVKYISHCLNGADITVRWENEKYKIPFCVLKDEYASDTKFCYSTLGIWPAWSRKDILEIMETYIEPIMPRMRAYLLPKK